LQGSLLLKPPLIVLILVTTMAERVVVRPLVEQPARDLAAAKSGEVAHGLLALALLTSILAAMSARYALTGQTVVLTVDSRKWAVWTHQKTVSAVLREVGLELKPADIVLPALYVPVQNETQISVQKALQVLVDADGQVAEHYTHCSTVGGLLEETGLRLDSHDVVTLDGLAATAETKLPRDDWAPQRWPLLRRASRRNTESQSSPPRLWIQRAIPLSIDDSGAQITVQTVARTVGEALLEQNITLYLGDYVQPLLGSLVTTGLHVNIHRAKPVSIQVDGRSIRTRTQGSNVAQLLSEANVILNDADYVIPALDTAVARELAVRVVRVAERTVLETESIAYQTIVRLDKSMELDQKRVDQAGAQGIKKRQIDIRYEDGAEVNRRVADEWVEKQPTTYIISYGTQIVLREAETPDGTIRYWRKVRMLATSYTAADGGKSRDHPQYGITRIGWKARRGIVAVDPSVVKLRTNVYVPGYGHGIAADTGGGVKGRWIDLCYDEGDLVLWWSWVDVYLLEPVPVASDINYFLPSYPVERR
jgi:resuscitation-promoting factor RpfB